MSPPTSRLEAAEDSPTMTDPREAGADPDRSADPETIMAWLDTQPAEAIARYYELRLAELGVLEDRLALDRRIIAAVALKFATRLRAENPKYASASIRGVQYWAHKDGRGIHRKRIPGSMVSASPKPES